MINKLYCMDNLKLMKTLESNSIDLIYSDILYGTGRDFGDYKDLKYDKQVIYDFYKPRIENMFRLLKDTGTLSLQMDFRISHWIRDICDEYFGYKNCVNEIIWSYKSGGASKSKLSCKHDNIIIYTKSINNQKFNLIKEKSFISHKYGFKGLEEYYDETAKQWYTLVNMRDVWNINIVPNKSKTESILYQTQKPLELMNRIRDLYTNENDIIADFFCGSGSMIVSAKDGNRNYIGCDINPNAIEITKRRIKDKINIL